MKKTQTKKSQQRIPEEKGMEEAMAVMSINLAEPELCETCGLAPKQEKHWCSTLMINALESINQQINELEDVLRELKEARQDLVRDLSAYQGAHNTNNLI